MVFLIIYINNPDQGDVCGVHRRKDGGESVVYSAEMAMLNGRQNYRFTRTVRM